MNRRDFLKTAGLLALTAPVGAAIVRAVPEELGADAALSFMEDGEPLTAARLNSIIDAVNRQTGGGGDASV